MLLELLVLLMLLMLPPLPHHASPSGLCSFGCSSSAPDAVCAFSQTDQTFRTIVPVLSDRII